MRLGRPDRAAGSGSGTDSVLTAETGEDSGRGSLRIFVNYRREDSSGHAGRLYDDLAEQFGENEVFIDIDKIEPGLDFGESIDLALGNCDVVLALIGRQWLTIADANGRRRLDNPDDYVRLELEAALARGTRLIPVRLQGVEMPSSAELPESLRGLARRHAVELSDTRWRHDVETLASVLARLAADNAERERREREQLEHERRVEEQAEQERVAREKAEQDRLALAEAERLRLVRELGEEERLGREKAEQERVAREQAEQKQRSREKAEQERLARERAEQERRAREQARKERLEHERAEKRRIAEEKAERDRLAREKATQERLIRQRKAAEQVAGEREAVAETRVLEGDVHARAARWSRRSVIGVAAGALVLGLGAVIAFTLMKGESDNPPLDTAPTSVSPPRISGTVRARSTLTAQRGAWGHSPAGFSYQWRRCDRTGVGCEAIRGATVRTYRLGDHDTGRRVRVSVTAANAAGSATSTSEATSVVAPALIAPANSARPTVSGTAQEGFRLVVGKGTWRGTKPISYRYVWQRCNAGGVRCSAIAGARGTTYTLRSSDVGRTLRVEVRASNAAGRKAAASRATPVVRATPDSPALPTPAPQPPTNPIERVPPPPDP